MSLFNTVLGNLQRLDPTIKPFTIPPLKHKCSKTQQELFAGCPAKFIRNIKFKNNFNRNHSFTDSVNSGDDATAYLNPPTGQIQLIAPGRGIVMENAQEGVDFDFI